MPPTNPMRVGPCRMEQARSKARFNYKPAAPQPVHRQLRHLRPHLPSRLQASASQQITVTGPATQAATETVEITSARKKKEADLPAMSRNELSILELAPSGMTAQNGNSIWRFGEHGAIAHSGDGGKTWKPQVAAVAATLISGSAPAKNICWIAGAAGTLLRTTDGGKHWQLIITPIAGDLGGVLASDGKHAHIWDAAHRETFQTSNGGKTWEKKTAD